MRHVLKNSGFTLIEMIVAMGISAFLIAATTAFFDPSARVFQDILSSDDVRLKISSAADALEREASDMRALYVDSTKCYALCMVDGSGNRVFYYWGGPTGTIRNLYRKKESTSNPIVCANGSVFASNLDTTNTSFVMTGNLLTTNVGALDPQNRPNRMFNVIFPSIQERNYIFTEGFECATLRNGWTKTDGSHSAWSLQGSANLGYYRIDDANTASGSDTAIIEIPLDLSRISSAHLAFSYMNSGSISSPDNFTVKIYDGSDWQTVYSDANSQSISTPKTIDADISGYSLNSSNKLQFSASLKNSGAHWYVDGVSVYSP